MDYIWIISIYGLYSYIYIYTVYIYIWVTVGFTHMYGHVMDYKPLLNIPNAMRIQIFRGMWDAHPSANLLLHQLGNHDMLDVPSRSLLGLAPDKKNRKHANLPTISNLLNCAKG